MYFYIRQVNAVNGGDIATLAVCEQQSINRLGVIAAHGVSKSICPITVLTEIYSTHV